MNDKKYDSKEFALDLAVKACGGGQPAENIVDTAKKFYDFLFNYYPAPLPVKDATETVSSIGGVLPSWTSN